MHLEVELLGLERHEHFKYGWWTINLYLLELIVLPVGMPSVLTLSFLSRISISPPFFLKNEWEEMSVL